MKNINACIIYICLFFLGNALSAQVGVGTTNPEGEVDVNDIDNYGLVIPRVTSVEDVTDGQGNTPVVGTAVFDISRNSYCYFSYDPSLGEGQWLCFTSNAAGTPTVTKVAPSASTRVMLFTESFESLPVSYTLSDAEGVSNNTNNYFTRVNQATPNINANRLLPAAGLNGTFYFGVQNKDNAGGVGDPATMIFTGIDITGRTNLQLEILLAEDDAGSDEDWDGGDSFLIEYRIDNGAYQNLLAVESDGTAAEAEPRLDTDFNGTGDGTTITSTWQNFQTTIGGTGNLLDIRITFTGLTDPQEDIGLDFIRISGE